MEVGALTSVVYNGLSQHQKPSITDKDGNALAESTDYTLSWSEDTTNVGTVTVTVTGSGNYEGTVTRTYQITPAPYTVTTNSAAKAYDGTPLTAPGGIVGLVNGETATVTTTGSRTEIGTSDNTYTLAWNGTAEESNYAFNGATIGTLTVVPQSIDPTDPTNPDPNNPDQPVYIGASVEAPADVMYNGQSQQQRPVVRDASGKPLVEGTDYTLSWTPATDVGTVTVTITGKGNYAGTVVKTYRITPRTVTLTSQSATRAYDGTALTRPAVTQTGNGFVPGEVTSITATGTVTNAGTVVNAITFTAGENYKAGNYLVNMIQGNLTVTPAAQTTVVITGNNAAVDYDGTEQSVTGFTHNGAGRMITVTIDNAASATASGTTAGRYPMGLTAANFTATSPNYRVVLIQVVDGYLTITGGDDDEPVVPPVDPPVQPPVQPPVEPPVEPAVEPPVDPQTPVEPPVEPEVEPEIITDEPTPLAEGTGAAWALVNLILTILTGHGSILLLIFYFGKDEKEAQDADGNPILDAEGNNVMYSIKKHGGWRLASLLPAIGAVIAFILTEDMRNPMILVDRWTLLMVIIAVIQIVVAVLSRKKTEEPEEETAAMV